MLYSIIAPVLRTVHLYSTRTAFSVIQQRGHSVFRQDKRHFLMRFLNTMSMTPPFPPSHTVTTHINDRLHFNKVITRVSGSMLRPYKVETHTTEKTANKRRRRLERPLALLAFVSIAILSNLSFLQRRLALPSDQATGPIMYTFYSEISDVPMPAGMSHIDHSRLLKFWIRSWTQAGWRAVVLNETHAQQHPDYDRLAPLVKKTGAGAYNVSVLRNSMRRFHENVCH